MNFSNNNHFLKSIQHDNHATIDVNLFYKINSIILVSIQYVGLVGNLLMLVVFYQGNLRKLSVSMYIRCLAIFCACQNSYFLFINYSSPFYADQSDILCRLRLFFNYFFRPLCAWFDVTASLDRFLAIVFPFRFRFIKKSIVRRFLAALVILINFVCYINFLLHDQITREKYGECVQMISHDQAVLDFVNGVALPFILMLILSVATFVGVLKAHGRVKSIGKENRARLTRIRDIRFGVTMIILNMVFFSFNLPYRLFFLLDLNSMGLFKSRIVVILFRNILYEFYEAYYSILFYIQLIVNNQVRREFISLLLRINHVFR